MLLKHSKTNLALFDAACQLFTQGEPPSLADIATTAGVGRATLHRHFSTREIFISEMALWALAALEKAGNAATRGAKSYEQAFWNIIEALIPLGDKYHFLITESPVQNHPKIKKAMDKSNRDMIDLIARLQKDGVLDSRFSPTWINAVIDALIYTAWEQIRAGDLAPNTAGDLVRKTVTNGFGKQNEEPA